MHNLYRPNAAAGSGCLLREDVDERSEKKKKKTYLQDYNHRHLMIY